MHVPLREVYAKLYNTFKTSKRYSNLGESVSMFFLLLFF